MLISCVQLKMTMRESDEWVLDVFHLLICLFKSAEVSLMRTSERR